jgi:hypothetical protein
MKPPVLASATRTRVCRFETSTLTASGAMNYTWTNISSASMNNTVITLTPAVVGNYTYVLTGVDQNNCKNTSTVTIQVQPCTGLPENQITGLKVYPNPSNGHITLESRERLALDVYNSIGQKVQGLELDSANSYSSTLDLPPGVYFISGSSASDGTALKVVVSQ